VPSRQQVSINCIMVKICHMGRATLVGIGTDGPQFVAISIVIGPQHIPMGLWYRDHQIVGVWDQKVQYLSPNLGPLEQICMVL